MVRVGSIFTSVDTAQTSVLCRHWFVTQMSSLLSDSVCTGSEDRTVCFSSSSALQTHRTMKTFFLPAFPRCLLTFWFETSHRERERDKPGFVCSALSFEMQVCVLN